MTSSVHSSVTLPSGEEVPAMGQGSWHFAERPARRASEIASLRLGVDLGMTVIDTAEMYANGAAETLVGEAISGRREDVFLVSKENVKIIIAPGKPDDLWKKIKTLRKQITSGESGSPLTKNLLSLYDLLIAPIESDLEPIKVVAFIPNQLLFYLPIQALARKQADGSTSRRGSRAGCWCRR